MDVLNETSHDDLLCQNANFWKKNFFSYRPTAWPGQARLKKAEKAYISAVNERILKIPFFHENYNELWIFFNRNIIFCSKIVIIHYSFYGKKEFWESIHKQLIYRPFQPISAWPAQARRGRYEKKLFFQKFAFWQNKSSWEVSLCTSNV